MDPMVDNGGGGGTGGVSVSDAASDFANWAESTYSVPAWLPGCFEGASASSFLGLYGCIQQNVDSTCISISAFQTMSTCATGILGNSFFSTVNTSMTAQVDPSQAMVVLEAFNNVSGPCLGPLTQCVNDTILDRIATVLEATCLPDALSTLEFCARNNAASCNASCTDSWLAHSSHLEMALGTINGTALDTCSGIQSEIVSPSCKVVTCCEPCVPYYEALMDCIANDVLTITEETCGFKCEAMSSGRQRRALGKDSENNQYAGVHSQHRALQNTQTGQLDACLQYAPGLTGSNATELASRAPYFIPCINAGMVTVIEAMALAAAGGGNTTTAGNGTGANSTGGAADQSNNDSFGVTAMPSFWTTVVVMAGTVWVSLSL